MQSILGKLIPQDKQLIEPSAYGLNYATHPTVGSRCQSMVNNQFCSDITFIVGPTKQRIYAHKYCLVTASEYFYSLFSGNFVEAQQKEVILEDTDPATFLAILQVVYGVKVVINDDNIRDIFDCMQRFMLNDFNQPLSDFLIGQIVDQPTAMEIFIQNDYYNLQLVHEKCMHYIQNNPLYFFAQESFLILESGRMAKILASKQINCTNEQLNNAFERWELANTNTNTKELWKLLKENTRSYYCHKLPLLGELHVESQQCAEPLVLKLESKEKLSLHGLGLYIKTKSVRINVALTISSIGFDATGGQSRSVNYFIPNRSTHGLQIVDLMFEELMLLPDKMYNVSIQITSSCNTYVTLSKPYLLHDNIKITFAGRTRDYRTFPIVYLWAKYPNCEMKATQGSAKCCYSHVKS